MGSSVPYTTVVVVTGANQGIGFEIAKKLGTEHSDYHIYVAGRRKDAVEEAVAKLKPLNVSCEPLVLDVTSDESIAAAVKVVEEYHGHLDVLINNAGISRVNPGRATAGEGNHRDRHTWRTVLDTNVSGVALVTDAFIPLLEKSKTTKRIVNISSTLGSINMKLDPKTAPWRKVDYWIVYAASKAALNMVTAFFATRFEDDQSWKVNSCCPGYCATNLNDYEGTGPVEDGAINACRLATQVGEDSESGTFTNADGPQPW
ncbi:hypothetical protein B0H66DRAFT_9669 [Apodospora peruviana]|uniref:Carbonyl reductase n=1 Tax=Apodospora peruviana TaxID=516989 RepID=A0AAE0MEP3_9PEZI|nr:hypothetical protein B0H66DRAFT_9669 [Apodospora peruviana]